VSAPHPRRWRALPAAVADIERLGEDDHRLRLRAVVLLDLVAGGRHRGRPLEDMAFYGDLSDCFKVYFGVDGAATHRIVYRVLDGELEVIEVVAVEQREEGYVYLLAAKRTGRITDAAQRSLDRVHQSVIRRRGEQRRRIRRRGG